MTAGLDHLERVELQIIQSNAHAGGNTGCVNTLELDADALLTAQHQQVQLAPWFGFASKSSQVRAPILGKRRGLPDPPMVMGQHGSGPGRHCPATKRERINAARKAASSAWRLITPGWHGSYHEIPTPNVRISWQILGR